MADGNDVFMDAIDYNDHLKTKDKQISRLEKELKANQKEYEKERKIKDEKIKRLEKQLKEKEENTKTS